MKSMLEMTMRVRENVFTRIKKTMTKKMYVLYYENHKDEPNYYRAIWFLNVYTNDGQIKMVLHK